METWLTYFLCSLKSLKRPHSLGILIEWKPKSISTICNSASSPHSLGILIEWKHPRTVLILPDRKLESPLAGDIN